MAVVSVADLRACPKQAWKLNSTALKSIRESGEDPPGHPVMQPGYGLELFDLDPFPIATLKRTTGMHYELTEPQQPWSWRGMLNGMNDATLERVVGPGITGICCMAMHGSYDHARRNAARELGVVFDNWSGRLGRWEAAAPVPVWDFVVTRLDGTRVRFHPSLTNSRIGISDFAAPFERDGPQAGPGKSDGRGTFRRMEASNYHETGRASNLNARDPARPPHIQIPPGIPAWGYEPPDAPDRGGGQPDPPLLPAQRPPAEAPPALGLHARPDYVYMEDAPIRDGGHPAPDPPPAQLLPAEVPPPPGLHMEDISNRGGGHPGALELERQVDPAGDTDGLAGEKFGAADSEMLFDLMD